LPPFTLTCEAVVIRAKAEIPFSHPIDTMKNTHPPKAVKPSDEEIETMLSKTSAKLFSRPTEDSGFLQRMLVVRKITSAIPMKKGSVSLASVHEGNLGSAGFKTIKKALTVGRNSSADWRVDDTQQKLSARHFSITLSGKNVVLTDLDSTNGTRVNEHPEKIKGPCLLHHGDFIHAGGCSFMIAIQED
jgi:hypothetical protein